MICEGSALSVLSLFSINHFMTGVVIANVFKQDPSLPAGMAKCEFCGNIDNYESYLNPSRR